MTGNKQNVELQGKEVWLEDFLNELADPAAPLTFEQVHFSRSPPFDSERGNGQKGRGGYLAAVLSIFKQL